jgi:hypothetical protein
LGPDDQEQEDIDGTGEIEHGDTEKCSCRWDLVVVEQ